MTLSEYLVEGDPNKFWRLSSGEHLNLLDEALDRVEKAAAEVDRLKAALENILSAKRARHSLGVFGQLVESIAEAALRGTKEERNGR